MPPTNLTSTASARSPRRRPHAPSRRRRDTQTQAVIILIDADTVTGIHQDTGKSSANTRSTPDRIYWRNQHKPPGQWAHQYEQ